MDYLAVLAGLVFLVLAGDALVRGAVNLSLRLGIPALIVSLTIVAFGTSAPELVVAVGAVLDGAPGIALGNVVGSNTANVLLVLGVPALLCRLATGQHDTRRSYAQMLGATGLFIVLAFFGPFGRGDGLILLAVLAAIIGEQIHSARLHHRNNGNHNRRDAPGTGQAQPGAAKVEGADPSLTGWRIGFLLVAGLVGLPIGAQLLVSGAVNIATAWGVSETVIGLTLVAVGTSLPELATTIVAALRRQADVAMGNVIGSNLFNLLGIVGIASIVGPIPVAPSFLQFDLWVMLAASLVLAPFVLRRLDMGRRTGIVLTALYPAYVIALLLLF